MVIVSKTNACVFWYNKNFIPTNGIRETSLEFKNHPICVGGGGGKRLLEIGFNASYTFHEMG
jgi:hypothetical protein